MENDLEFAGAALATSFMIRGLVTALIDKGILSHDECSEMFDHLGFLMERQQNYDVPANAEVWRIGRNLLNHLTAYPSLYGAPKVSCDLRQD